MNPSDADRQIQQMIAFIKQEASEKAEEIEVKTNSACTAEKLNLTMQMSLAIREDHDRKQKDKLIQKRIERSKLVNGARVGTMKMRSDLVDKVKTEILTKLGDVKKHKQYPELLRLLIIEAAMQMNESTVYVQARKEDQDAVKAQLDGAKKGYESIMSKASGKKITVNFKFDDKEFLPPGPKAGQQGDSCSGGVVLHANGKKMICRNTLDSRLDIAFANLKPTIRGMLFGYRPKSSAEEKKE